MPKPDRPCFDKTWIARCRVRLGSISECRRFFRAHYLRTRPAVVPLILTIEVDGLPSGMVCFALPPKETSVRYGCACWELARLWLDDSMPTNAETWAIAQAVRYVKKHHPEIGLLVSYADPSVGHQGTIYLAANWEREGRTDEGRKTAKFDYTVTEPTLFGEEVKRFSRAAHVPEGATVGRLARVSKPRFIYRLRK